MSDMDKKYPKRFRLFPGPVREKREVFTRMYEYTLPFKYSNIEVERTCGGGEPHGMELNLSPLTDEDTFEYGTKIDGPGGSNRYSDGIVIVEEEPIIRVEVIGSACTPPGYITLEAEPIEEWYGQDEVREAMPVRMRVDNLWGMHLRFDQVFETAHPDTPPDRPGPERMPERWKPHAQGGRIYYQDMPLAGMSSACFSTPPCCKVRVSGGSANPGWQSDNSPDDNHYSFRMIRVTVEAKG